MLTSNTDTSAFWENKKAAIYNAGQQINNKYIVVYGLEWILGLYESLLYQMSLNYMRVTVSHFSFSFHLISFADLFSLSYLTTQL